MTTFAFSRIKTTGPGFRATLEAITAGDDAAIAPAKRWGAFFGLFGVHSSEFILVTSGDVANVDAALDARGDIESVNTILLEPTVRPESDAEMTVDGLYVFRFFDVAHKDVDEIAALSKQAWETFEDTDAYDAVPQALFRESNPRSDTGIMLLCTRYDGLESWQTSRAPHPDARANFQRRGALTQGTVAYATRLIPR